MAKRGRNGNVRHSSGLVVRNARLARARPFKWAWEGRVLMSYLNLLIGEEGIGKGNIVAWVAARITRGTLPGELSGKPSKVAIVGDEDSFDHVWVPRLKAAGADLKLVKYIVAGTNGILDVQHDAEALSDYIEGEGIALTYFDQLLDNLGFTDSWKDKQVRDALAPLRAVAQETESAMLASMHPNKRGGSFRDRISGTTAFNALSRSGLLVAPHPSGPGRVVLVRPKGNYTGEPPAFEFRIEEHAFELGKGKRRRLITTSRLVSERETGLRSADILDAKPSRRKDTSKAGKARRLLSGMFSDGEPRSAGEVQQALAKQHRISPRIATRAAEELGFQRWKDGYQGEWFWQARAEEEDV